MERPVISPAGVTLNCFKTNSELISTRSTVHPLKQGIIEEIKYIQNLKIYICVHLSLCSSLCQIMQIIHLFEKLQKTEVPFCLSPKGLFPIRAEFCKIHHYPVSVPHRCRPPFPSHPILYSASSWAPSSLSCLHYPVSSSTLSFSRSPPPCTSQLPPVNLLLAVIPFYDSFSKKSFFRGKETTFFFSYFFFLSPRIYTSEENPIFFLDARRFKVIQCT